MYAVADSEPVRGGPMRAVHGDEPPPDAAPANAAPSAAPMQRYTRSVQRSCTVNSINTRILVNMRC